MFFFVLLFHFSIFFFLQFSLLPPFPPPILSHLANNTHDMTAEKEKKNAAEMDQVC